MFESVTNYFKWLLVILTLLYVPYGILLTLIVFLFLYFRGNLSNLDLLLLYFLIFFVQNVNGGDGTSDLGSLRYSLIFVSFLKSNNGFSFRSLFSKAIYFPLLFLFLLLHSLFFSYDPFNSLVELSSFTLMIFFTYKSSYFGSIPERNVIVNNIEAMFIAIIICSAFSIFQPAISYLKNGVGFQGISLHPNAFGIVLAPFTGFLLIKLFNKFSKKDFVFFIFSFVFTYLSLSRTSLLSIFLGLAVIVMINSKLRRLITKKILVLFSLGSILLLFYYSKINSFIFRFLNKSNAETIQDSFIASRGSLVENQIDNIIIHPFFGIGFKMPSDLIPLNNPLTIGKAYEKGNLFLASIEELGVIGAIILLLTIISLLKIEKQKNSPFLIITLIALFTNFGEATLFSVGGIGVLIWTFVFLCMHNGILEDKLIRVNKKVN
ncbi:O-antigen ligase family protein [Aequorivita flava]|uniref:O-antigen ligase family protein n=1 Tax=Aequorivita flava TaxID=3114371 RepID=A0AB35YSK2_9FLAO